MMVEQGLDREKLEALVKLQEMIDRLSFNEMMELIANKISETLGIERCSIFKIAPELERAYLITGVPKGDAHGFGMNFSFSELPAIKEVVESKRYLVISDPGNDPRTAYSKDLIYFRRINAILFLPLLAKDGVIGVIVVDATDAKKGFTENDLYFCVNLGNLVSLLIERDLLFKEKTEKENLMLLGRAAAEVAHRLRTPLVVIGGFARRLNKMKEITEESVKNYSKIIASEVERMEAIINNLLKFSRSRKTEFIEVDINKMLSESQKLVAELAKDKVIKVTTKFDPDLPRFLCNPIEVEDAFHAILHNAVEEIENEGEILIKTKTKEKGIIISITNTGSCVEEKIVKEIFNPFFTTKQNGTGLGLAIALAAIKAYKGDIEVKNDEALKHTTFVITFPLPAIETTEIAD